MGRILVIGSVHLDIVAEVDSSTRENLDKMGRLKYSVGGSAFNVAANLAFHEEQVAIFSVLKDGSFSAEVIEAELARRGLSARWLRRVAMSTESGFVAHTEDGQLVSAVSCIGIQDVVLDERQLQSAVAACSLVAIECNLAPEQIERVTHLAARQKKPVCICAVSESKVRRIYQVFPEEDPAFQCVILNSLELKKAMGIGRIRDAIAACRAFSTKYLVVTKGQDGFTVADRSGGIKDFAVAIENVVSTLGAGDALFAAFCRHLSEHGDIEFDRITVDAKRFLAPVLSVSHAAPEEKRSFSSTRRTVDTASIVTLVALTLATTGVVYGFFGAPLSRRWFGAILFAIAMAAGLAGSQVESLLLQSDPDPFKGHRYGRILVRATLGVASGVVTALLFVLPHLVGSQEFQGTATSVDVSFQLRVLLPFCLLASFIGGMTADTALQRIRGRDVDKLFMLK